MNARDMIKKRVALVLEKDRYRKALQKIIQMQHDLDTEEHEARDLSHAVAVAEYALRKVKP